MGNKVKECDDNGLYKNEHGPLRALLSRNL